jgi:hypothetical protein
MKRLRNALLCIVLALASAGGMAMRPDEIEELLKGMSQPKIVRSLPDETLSGDDRGPIPARRPNRSQ